MTTYSIPGPLRTLGERVDWIVRHVHGSQRAAAAVWGVQRSTLVRIVAGQVSMPRGDVLERIARSAETTIDWLLTGRGPEPEVPVSEPMFWTPARHKWAEVVSRLELDAATHAAMIALPAATQRLWSIDLPQKSRHQLDDEDLEALAELETLELGLWTKCLEGLIRKRPLKAIRLALQRNRNAILLGMSRGGIHLDEMARSADHAETLSLLDALEATSNHVVAAHPRSRVGKRGKSRPRPRGGPGGH
jgi:hypothetical protein